MKRYADTTPATNNAATLDSDHSRSSGTMKHMKFHEKQGHLGGFRRRSTFNAQLSVQNLECGDKSRAVRGSRHRFLSALCAETLLVLTLNAFALALVCGCAVCEKTAQPAIGPAAPLVFTGDVRGGALIEAPGGAEQTFECWFMALGMGQGDKPYDRIVQTPDWYLHTIASEDEVSALTFGYTGADGKVQGFGNLGGAEGVYFGKWQHVAVTYAPEGFRVYLNGTLISGAKALARALPESLKGGLACLGNSSFGAQRAFKGKIAGARLLDRALSAAEVAARATINPDGKPIEVPPSAAATEADRIPVVDISTDASRQVIIAEVAKDRYEGHPTTLLADDGRTMFCVWTTGHGGPCGQMARSDDGGLTWTRLDATLPEVYGRTHQNCPVLQKAKGPDGKMRYFIYSAKAREGRGLGILMSEDLGKSWREMPFQAHLSAGMPPTGFMVLKDGTCALFGQIFKSRAKAKDRPTDDQAVWMSVSQDGGIAGPSRIVAEADRRNLCEPCCLRSPDGNTLVLLMRENRHRGRSMMCFSRDEGQTWTTPLDTPWALTGDRHEGVLLPDGRYVIAFRDRAIGSETYGQFMAWVGTWEDIVHARPGQYRIHLLRHYGRGGVYPSGDGDTGYPGVELLPDGTLVCTTYTRHFPDDRQSSVVLTRFKIEEIDNLYRKAK